MADADTAVQRRVQITEEIHALLTEYTHLSDYAENTIVTSFYVVAELLYPTGGRVLLEVSDAQSSKYQAMGMLHAALHDPAWLPLPDSSDD